MGEPERGRIIRTFQKHREIRDALKALAHVRDEQERLRRAQALAQHGNALIPILLRHLDTTDPFLRGAMGLVVSFLPREHIVPRLREIVTNPARNDQERMTALMFLERFLGEPVEESVYAQLRDPAAVITQSLREVTTYQEESPDLLLEYVSQLQEEPTDVALMVLAATEEFPIDSMYPLLLLLAQDVREPVALATIDTLEHHPGPESLAILHLLAHLAEGPVKERGRRAFTKMRMRGIRAHPPATVQWRALVTPPDIHGSQAFWLLRDQDGNRTLLGLLTNTSLGIQFAFHLTDVPNELIPQQPLGHLLPVAMGEDPAHTTDVAWFLETPLATARRWLRNIVRQNYRSEYQLPVIYRYWASHFWQETDEEGEAESPPIPTSSHMPSLEEAFLLFRHPVLHQWYVEPRRNPEMEREWIHQGLEYSTLLKAFINLKDDIPTDIWPSLGPTLRLVAEWMFLAGEEKLAQYALDGAQAMEERPYSENPYAQALILRGLDHIFAELRQARDHWDD